MTLAWSREGKEVSCFPPVLQNNSSALQWRGGRWGKLMHRLLFIFWLVSILSLMVGFTIVNISIGHG